MDFGYWEAHNLGLPPAKIRKVPMWRDESGAFTELERLVMEWHGSLGPRALSQRIRSSSARATIPVCSHDHTGITQGVHDILCHHISPDGIGGCPGVTGKVDEALFPGGGALPP